MVYEKIFLDNAAMRYITTIMGCKWMIFCTLLLLVFWLSDTSEAFSFRGNNNNDNNDNQSLTSSSIRRRDLLTWPIGIAGAVVYGKLVSDSVSKLSRGDLIYPDDHDRRVEEIISKSLVAAASASSSGVTTVKNYDETRPLRVLEVGIGKEWRVGRRGLYTSAWNELSLIKGVSNVQLTGVDISIPDQKILDDARRRISNKTQQQQNRNLKLLK